MTPITLKDYLGPYDDDRITREVRENGSRLIAIANVVLAAAEAEGVEIKVNPNTGNHIAGSGNGGVRPVDAMVGAKNSAHKRGHAIDIYDPERKLSGWVWVNKNRVELLGIRAVERPEYTPSWCHLADEPVASGVFAFVPYAGPAPAEMIPEQIA